MPPCERVYEERASGASADRRNLVACLDYRCRGDSLVVFSLDRVRRLAGELITLIDELSERDIGFRHDVPVRHRARPRQCCRLVAHARVNRSAQSVTVGPAVCLAAIGIGSGASPALT